MTVSAPESARPTVPSPMLVACSAMLDAVFVTIFAAMGRAEHGSGHPIIGVLDTAWPFLVALAIVWGLALVWRAPAAPVRSGLAVWLGTLTLGMLLRVLFTAGGAALPFVLVAAGFLGVTLLGWRLVWTGITRTRRRH